MSINEKGDDSGYGLGFSPSQVFHHGESDPLPDEDEALPHSISALSSNSVSEILLSARPNPNPSIDLSSRRVSNLLADPQQIPVTAPSTPHSVTLSPRSPAESPNPITLQERVPPVSTSNSPRSDVELKERHSKTPLELSQEKITRLNVELAKAKLSIMRTENQLDMIKEESQAIKKIKLCLVALVVIAVFAALLYTGVIALPMVMLVGAGLSLSLGALSSVFYAGASVAKIVNSTSEQNRIYEDERDDPFHSIITGIKGKTIIKESVVTKFAKLSSSESEEDRKKIQNFKAWIEDFKAFYQPIGKEEREKHFKDAGSRIDHQDANNLVLDVEAYDIYVKMQMEVAAIGHKIIITDVMQGITKQQISLMKKYGFVLPPDSTLQTIAEANIDILSREGVPEVDDDLERDEKRRSEI